MALIRNFDLQGGITVENAYFVVSFLNANKKLLDIIPGVPDPETGITPDPTTSISQKWACQIGVSVFKSKAQREAGGDALQLVYSASPGALFDTSFEYDPSGPLPIVQGYIYLMGQDYFADATSDADS